ncbi:MAG TPA: ABC transporter permease [Candidatus Avipropionibacterium avicola]|uniref:ABC transporter permease n=1 Tax=Candidatus Avipropionibacterium avicola TaxID=2840701 RepID=A0A9D1GZK5_9ACTN|nr:ABC transporter permease [Candidatus Avipropionibacterium avicola]
MIRYLLGRLVRLVLSLFAVSIITFVLLQLVPGSYSDLQGADVGSGLGGSSVVGGSGGGAGGEEQPAWLSYVQFMKGAITWDMPASYKYPQLTVNEIIEQAFPVSFTIAFLAMIVSVCIAIPTGLIAAARQNKFLDYGPMFLFTVITALPGYLFALVLILVFASWLRLLPTGGWNGPQYAIIPVLALGLEHVARMARFVRTSVLESLREEYVVAARAKGATPATVWVRHVLRNSLIPVVTVAGPMFAAMATGTVFIEALMGIPGLGMFFSVAARTRDLPLMMGATLFFAVLLMLVNLLVDLSYRLLDPRIRYQTPRTSVRSRRLARAQLEAVNQNG